MDCNSKPPYKPSDDYTLVKVPEPFNIARSLNVGYAATKGEWLLFSNDDVLCEGKFADLVRGLDKDTLYANAMMKRPSGLGMYPNNRAKILYGWLMIIHRKLFNKLGPFDENSVIGIDIEYSLRASEVRVPLVAAGLPFRHIHNHRRG